MSIVKLNSIPDGKAFKDVVLKAKNLGDYESNIYVENDNNIIQKEIVQYCNDRKVTLNNTGDNAVNQISLSGSVNRLIKAIRVIFDISVATGNAVLPYGGAYNYFQEIAYQMSGSEELKMSAHSAIAWVLARAESREKEKYILALAGSGATINAGSANVKLVCYLPLPFNDIAGQDYQAKPFWAYALKEPLQLRLTNSTKTIAFHHLTGTRDVTINSMTFSYDYGDIHPSLQLKESVEMSYPCKTLFSFSINATNSASQTLNLNNFRPAELVMIMGCVIDDDPTNATPATAAKAKQIRTDIGIVSIQAKTDAPIYKVDSVMEYVGDQLMHLDHAIGFNNTVSTAGLPGRESSFFVIPFAEKYALAGNYHDVVTGINLNKSTLQLDLVFSGALNATDKILLTYVYNSVIHKKDSLVQIVF